MEDDIYGDLENYNDLNALDELRKDNQELKYKIEEYASTIAKLQKDYDKVTSDLKTMEINFSSLLKTARAEIERKTQIINNLNLEKDQLIFSTLQNSNRNILSVRKNIVRNRSLNKNNSRELEGEKGNRLSWDYQEQTKLEERGRNDEMRLPSVDTISSGNTDETNKLTNVSNQGKSVLSYSNKTEEIKENISDIKKTRSQVIRNRSKSISSINKPIMKFSSDDEYEDNYSTEETHKKEWYSKEDKQHKIGERPYTEKFCNKISETSGIDEKYSSYHESSRETYYKSSYGKMSDRYRNPKEKREIPHRHIRSPERSYRRAPKERFDERCKKPEYRRYRSSESPPTRKYISYHRNRSRERRSNVEREYYERSRSRHDRYNYKHKLHDYDEPSSKRARTDSSNQQIEIEKDHNELRDSVAELHIPKNIGDLTYMSCQSPDFANPEPETAPVKEIMDTATTHQEDPRLTSKKYMTTKENDKIILSTITGRNVDLQLLDTSEWNIQRVEIPIALREPPEDTDRIVQELYGDIDPVSNFSFESGEIQSDCADCVDNTNVENHSYYKEEIKRQQDSSRVPQESSKSQQDTSKSQQDSSKSQQELSKSQQDTGKRQQESSKSQQESSKSQLGSSKSQQEPSKSQQESSKSQQESNKSQQESSKSQQESNKSQQDSSKSQKDSSNSQQDSSKSQKDSSKSQQDSSKSQQDSSKSQQDSSKSQQDSSKSQQDSSKSQQESSKSQQYSSKSQQDSSKSQQDSSKSQQESSKSQQESSKSQQFNNQTNENEDKHVENIIPPECIPKSKYKIPKIKIIKETVTQSLPTPLSKLLNQFNIATDDTKNSDKSDVDQFYSPDKDSNKNEPVTYKIETLYKVQTSIRDLVEGDLELSDETSDHTETIRKKSKSSSNEKRIPQETVNEEDNRSLTCKEKAKRSKTITSSKNKGTRSSKEDKNYKTISENGTKQKHKKRSQKPKADIKEPKATTKTEEMGETRPSRLKKDTKPKEIKAKFHDLFGESSSLITPEDLGALSEQKDVPNTNKCVPFFEDAQDAVDLNIKMCAKSLTISTPTQIDSFTTHIDITEVSNPKQSISAKTSTEPIKEYKKKHESEDITEKPDLFVNVNPGALASEIDVVNTVIISSGVQPQVAGKGVTPLPLVDYNVVDTENEAVAKSLAVPIALATSTPHKSICQTLVDSRLPDSSCSSSDSKMNRNDISVDNSCQSNTIVTGDNSEVPDVRIFVKRRRKFAAKKAVS